MKKHLRVLEEAGLVRSEKVGRARRCRLAPGRLDEARAWIDGHRRMVEERFDRIEALLDETKGDPR
jgi:DNA-binding transcriptional ArsR family regulator